MGISIFPTPSSSSLFSRSELLTSSGTWVHPDGYASPRTIYVVCHGGGGGGGNGVIMPNMSTTAFTMHPGTGGGSGYVMTGYMVVSGNTTYSIGAGGTGSTPPTPSNSTGADGSNNATSGGTTIFGNFVALGGGAGRRGERLTTSGQEVFFGGTSGGNPARASGRADVSSTGGAIGGIDGVSGGVGVTEYARDTGFSGFNGIEGNISRTNVSLNGNYIRTDGVSDLAAYVSGSGAGGGRMQNSTTAQTQVGGTGGYGIYRGGNGGTSTLTLGTDPSTGTAGSAGGFGGGGGGGGGAASKGLGLCTAGAGGAGGSGFVLIFY